MRENSISKLPLRMFLYILWNKFFVICSLTETSDEFENPTLFSFLSSIAIWYIRKKTNVVNRRIKIWEMNLCHAFGYSQESSVLAAGLLSLEREGFFFSSSSIEIIKLYYPFTWHSFVFQLNPVLYLPLNVGSLGRAKKYIPLSIWLLNFIRESVNKRVGMFYGVP